MNRRRFQKRFFQVAGGCPPAFLYVKEGRVGDLSIFVDESGDQEGRSKYYVLTLLFHDQAVDLAAYVARQEHGLTTRRLDVLPFHTAAVLNGHEDYENKTLEERKSYFSQFFLTVQKLPITYHSFIYRRSEFQTKDDLSNRMRRDVTNLLFDHLAWLQSFDHVKVYYDNGQQIVGNALHAAVEYVLSRNSLVYRITKSTDFLLAQAADLLCSIELTATKIQHGEYSGTEQKFYGSERMFKRNYLKYMKRKRLENAA